MKNLNFLQDNEDFLKLLQEKEKTWDENSILPVLNKILKDNGIFLKSLFFLESYLSTNKECEFLNTYFLELFHKAIHFNEKISMLDCLLINNYDKELLCIIIFEEIKKEYTNYSYDEVEHYRWQLCEILYRIGLKKYENKYIELLKDCSLGESRQMLIYLLKKIKAKQRKDVFKELKKSDPFFNDYKYF